MANEDRSIEFESHPTCVLCTLCAMALRPGLPCRSLYDGQIISKNIAILFVGQSPGHKEDLEGKSFVGFTGSLLQKFIELAKLPDYADIYLTNAVRCKPPQGGEETQRDIRQCREYLQKDIRQLRQYYQEVIIVALGAKACYSIVNISSLNEALKKQGMRTILFTDAAEIAGNPRVFFTYHPAILHHSRKPALVRVVQIHFELLLRYLKGEFYPNELIVSPIVGAKVPDKLPHKVALDIETYGILAGQEQTVFNPQKSRLIDNVDYPNQIVSVSFAWRSPIDGQVNSAFYQWDSPSHRNLIRQWFQKISQEHIVLDGQNIKYDLLYLYFSGDKELRYWISPERLTVDDTMILSFLYFEQQPEKGLKELAALYGISDYLGYGMSDMCGTVKSSSDKRLQTYNCLDAATTLVLAEELEKRIAERYGNNSPKLGIWCKWMRNCIIWDTFDLERNGSTFDLNKLQVLHNSLLDKVTELAKQGDKENIKFAGEGSDAPLRNFMLDCVSLAGLLDDKRIIYSDKTKKISIGLENVLLVLRHLPVSKEKEILELYEEHKKKLKLVNTYTKPLLEKPRQGIVERNGSKGMVYPSWFPVPSYIERGGVSEEQSGGQIQGRFSCRKPARQTEPSCIQECSTSRWPEGKLVQYDVNQDHLRMAALLSGDPYLMEAYLNPKEINIHTQTALVIFPETDPVILTNKMEWKKSKEYKLGKTLNFLTIFKGGAEAFQRTALEDTGIELTLDFCQQAIAQWYLRYNVYAAWQIKMIQKAINQGYLDLPTGWSRTFGPAGSNLSAFEGEILNFLHQTPCAQITQSSHYQILTQFQKYRLRSVVCLQVYDSIFVDIYPAEEKKVDEIVGEALTHPPLLPVFEQWAGRSIPWAYEKCFYSNEDNKINTK